MRVIPERQLSLVFGALPGTPRVVVGGNFEEHWARDITITRGLVDAPSALTLMRLAVVC
jgi:hypothetical protein